MSRLLGSKLVDSLMGYLRADPRTHGTKVILATTVDERGWPRIAMLSLWEVFAKDRSSLRVATYASSSTTKNLLRDGLLTLIIVDEGMSYYVNGTATLASPQPRGDSSNLIFDVKVESVLEDTMPGVSIVHGIEAEGAAEAEPHVSLYQELSGSGLP